MKKLYSLLFSLLISLFSYGQDLIISGVYDGPLTGGVPKGVELFVVNNIADLSIYGIGSANNGGGTDGEEFTFPADAATAGDYIYVASEDLEFSNFFGFAPNYNAGSAMGINGDDAIELFMNGGVIDVFGDINVDGNGEPWEYLDGWAYRVDDTGPDGSTFVLANWTFSGPNAFDGQTTNASATTPIPIGTFTFGTASVNRNEISNFSMYPNPVSGGKLTINTLSNASKKIQVFDIIGKQVLNTILEGNELNVSNLYSGIYIIKILEEGKTATRKLVIK